MKNGTFLQTHLFLQKQLRKIEQDGDTIFHLQCSTCGRDYVKLAINSQWHAAYVGVFLVQLLPESVTARWIEERCPGLRLESDADDRAKHDDHRRERAFVKNFIRGSARI